MHERKEQVIRELKRHGVASAFELASALDVSQPTLSRALSGLPSKYLHRMGAARSTRYAWRREIEGGTSWPLYQVAESGEAVLLAHLHPLSDGSWHVQADRDWGIFADPLFPEGVFPDWPWFLKDLKPRGFLGRLFAKICAERLSLPPDARDWTADHTLRALLRFGDDVPGGFVLGRDALATALQSAEPTGPPLRPGTLVEHAKSVLAGVWPGSSAAGEQPKFTLKVKEEGASRGVLVKFSGEVSDPVQARWGDLLRAEHTANRVLLREGIPAARTEIIEEEGRVFLLADRFDRTDRGGRRAMVSLYAVNAAFGDVNRTWADSAEDLHAQGWLDAGNARQLSRIWAFGRRIGNTDMHDGNMSLFLSRGRPFPLTPVYDMTTMALAPRADGSLPDVLPTLPPLPPEHRAADDYAEALDRRFRREVLDDERFTPSFRQAFA